MTYLAKFKLLAGRYWLFRHWGGFKLFLDIRITHKFYNREADIFMLWWPKTKERKISLKKRGVRETQVCTGLHKCLKVACVTFLFLLFLMLYFHSNFKGII